MASIRFAVRAVAVCVLLSSVAAGQTPASSTSRYVWDLASVYPTDAEWDAELREVNRRLADLPRLRGRSGMSAGDLASVLDEVRSVRATAGRMARFALLSSEVDGSSQVARTRLDAATALETQVEAAVAFVEAEVRAIGPERVQAWQKTEPRLSPHRRRLHKIFAEAPHVPHPLVQSTVATMERWPSSLADAASTLSESELGWTSIRNEQGEPTRVDLGNFTPLRRSSNAAVRQAATQAVMGRQRALQNSYGLLLSRRIEGNSAIAKLRNFDDHIDAFYKLRDGLPVGSYHHAAGAARNARNQMIRLGRVLKRLHGADRATLDLFYPRPFTYSRAISVEDAIANAIAASAPLGGAYQQSLAGRLAQRWMHLPPQPNKSGTVGVFWQVGGGHPYSLLTYRDDLQSSRVFTMAATLMMTYADIPAENYPDRREEDPPIHGNVIWYTGALLHDSYLLSKTTDREDRLALLLQSLQTQVRSLAHYSALVELERAIAVGIAAKKPLTGEQISQTYLQILRTNFAHDGGGIAVDDIYAYQWTAEENAFFAGPYPAVFLSAAAGAALLAEKLEDGDEQAIAGMRNAMSRGDSDYSHDLLLKAGVDLSTRAPYEALVRSIDHRLSMLERELASK